MKRLIGFGFLLLPWALPAQDTVTFIDRHQRAYKRSDFVKDLSAEVNFSLFAAKVSNGFTLSGGRDIQYSPNEGMDFGIRFQHKWLGFALSWSPRRLQNANIGQTDFVNLLFNSYGKRIGFDLYLLSYRGYFIENTRDLEQRAPGSGNKRNPFQFRYDLKTLNTGFNVYYLFNNIKYSYRSTFLQNEWQKKSAGSFFLNSSFNYYRIHGDSTIVPARYDPEAEEEGRLKSGDFYSFVLMPGYAHTFVISGHFFITFSPSAGVMYQLQSYITEHDRQVNRYGLFPRVMGRAGLGYNSERFYFGFSSISDVFSIQLARGTRINNQISSFMIYAGIRIGVPRSLQKASDFLGRFDPVNLISAHTPKN